MNRGGEEIHKFPDGHQGAPQRDSTSPQTEEMETACSDELAVALNTIAPPPNQPPSVSAGAQDEPTVAARSTDIGTNIEDHILTAPLNYNSRASINEDVPPMLSILQWIAQDPPWNGLTVDHVKNPGPQAPANTASPPRSLNSSADVQDGSISSFELSPLGENSNH